MKVIPSQEIAFRYDFPILCNARGLTKTAIEVGTDLGVFANDFLSRWKGEKFICVDPYLPYEEMESPRDCDRMMAVNALQKHWPRVRFYTTPSPQAVKNIQKWERPADFIYIDGSHVYENVLTDLKAWFPLIAVNGIFAGHDYDKTHPGVIRAVNEFCDSIGQPHIYVTTDEQASWFFYAGNEPKTLIRRYFVDQEIDNPN